MLAGSWQDLPTTRLSGVLINPNGENACFALFFSALRLFMKVTPTSGGWDIVIDIIDSLTGWTVRISNPGGGEIFRSRPGRPRGLPSLLYSGYRH
jgi:hypothetical protein